MTADFTLACQSSPWPSLLDHLISTASHVIECCPTSNVSTYPLNLPLSQFAHYVIGRAPVPTVAILGAILYLSRAKSLLPPSARGIESTQHRLLFAALLISSKMFQDRQIKNISWGRAMGLSLAEVNLMERQMLILLNYKVSLNASEIESELNQVPAFTMAIPDQLESDPCPPKSRLFTLPPLDMSFIPTVHLPTPLAESPKDSRLIRRSCSKAYRRDSVLSVAAAAGGSEYFVSPTLEDPSFFDSCCLKSILLKLPRRDSGTDELFHQASVIRSI